MKSQFYILLAFLAISHALPGDIFETCSNGCSKDATERLRMNQFHYQDTEKDRCALKCGFDAQKLMNEKGDVDWDKLAAATTGTAYTLDMTPITVKNLNAPGFVTSFQAFVDKNRATLVKLLKHEEAAV